MPLVIMWHVLVFCISCGSRAERDGISLSDEEVLRGKELSEKYCQSCHSYPDPSDLDKKTWERSVLPLMGRRFGIYEAGIPRSEVIKGAVDKQAVEQMNLFPHHPLISAKEWAAITEYYLSEAPEKLKSISWRDYMPLPLEGFETVEVVGDDKLRNVTLLKKHDQSNRIYVGAASGEKGMLGILDSAYQVVQVVPLPSPPTDVTFKDSSSTISLIGSLVLSPSDNVFGSLLTLLRASGSDKYSSFMNFATPLNRPVQLIQEDVNGDGLEDILVAEFGYYTGAVTLFENTGRKENPYTKKTIKNTPGAIRMMVTDVDGDGRKDIMVLFAQGDEGISVFLSDGKNNFVEKRILDFPPSYGSVHFELVDFNRDGFLDILYANGDNGDYPPVAKPYHGVRIFENDGKNNFKEVYFFPMNGVNKCAAADFDKDGDLEIVAISFFPDLKSSERMDFVYLKKEADYSYRPYVLHKNYDAKWLTFDIGDVDNDGDLDIILGSNGKYNISSSPVSSMLGSILILENQIHYWFF